MTTIAFDGKVLAADRQQTYGDDIGYRVKKIKAFKDGCLVGGAGDAWACDRIIAWLEKPERRRGLPPKIDGDDVAVEVLLIKRSGVICLVDNRGHIQELTEKVAAIGSGAQYALALLEMGVSATEAVLKTAKRISGTGLGVDTLELKASP
jgi:20S proteasome alpha/beta subunit